MIRGNENDLHDESHTVKETFTRAEVSILMQIEVQKFYRWYCEVEFGLPVYDEKEILASYHQFKREEHNGTKQARR